MSGVLDIWRALVQAFDGIDLGRADGKKLRSVTTPIADAPRLTWKLNGFTGGLWAPYQTQYKLSIPAEYKTQVAVQDTEALIREIATISEWGDMVYGLPVDADGKVVPYGERQLALAAKGELYAIGERFVGPWVQSATVRQGAADDSIAFVDFVWYVECVVDNTPDPIGTVRQVNVGANVFAGNGQAYRQPLDDDMQIVVPLSADVSGQGGFAEPKTVLGVGGAPARPSFPPLVGNLPAVSGTSPLLKEINVRPLTGSIAVAGTLQLQAIGIYDDGTSKYLTSVATWTSSAPTKATVAAGLVTGVATGSSIITASYGGVSNTAAITVA